MSMRKMIHGILSRISGRSKAPQMPLGWDKVETSVETPTESAEKSVVPVKQYLRLSNRIDTYGVRCLEITWCDQFGHERSMSTRVFSQYTDQTIASELQSGRSIDGYVTNSDIDIIVKELAEDGILQYSENGKGDWYNYCLNPNATVTVN